MPHHPTDTCPFCGYTAEGLQCFIGPEWGKTYNAALSSEKRNEQRHKKKLIAMRTAAWVLSCWSVVFALIPYVCWLVAESIYPEGATPAIHTKATRHAGAVWMLGLYSFAVFWIPIAVPVLATIVTRLSPSPRNQRLWLTSIMATITGYALLALYLTPLGSTAREWWFD